MRIDEDVISAQLEKIRVRHGLDLTPFIPYRLDIGKDLTTREQVKSLFHSSGLLILDGQPVLAYIRDHMSFGPDRSPEEYRKVHFTVCSTLKNMKTLGRFERYRITNKETNRYLIDVSIAWDRTEEREVKLYPCQNCLHNLSYNNFHYALSYREKRDIVEGFDAKEFFSLARIRLTRFWQKNVSLGQATKNANSATLPSVYPKNWNEISGSVRRGYNFICDKCKVRLEERPHLLHTHHINGDKQNVQPSNLRCLCILCHYDEHPHLRVEESDRSYIEDQRTRQGR